MIMQIERKISNFLECFAEAYLATIANKFTKESNSSFF